MKLKGSSPCGKQKKVLKGNFVEENSNMAHDELKLKTKEENIKIVHDKSKPKSKQEKSNMAYDILKLESIQFDPDEKRVNYTGGFLPGESPDDVHLWAIPLINKMAVVNWSNFLHMLPTKMLQKSFP